MSQRKLYQEIDKLLKKVRDGLQDFDQVYDNFQDSEPSQHSYREKLEGDLKGIIKKLQKQREQIKTWMSKEDVKDREKLLLENRRLIENGMERFKSVEKLMKLKQFSTQALSNPNIVLNPKEIKKAETGDFIEECIEELRKQMETLESNEDHEKIERHNFHIANLENILRLINSNTLDCETVDEYKEDITYYVENNLEDPDFVEYDTLYEDMGCEVQPKDMEVNEISFAGSESSPKKEPKLNSTASVLFPSSTKVKKSTSKNEKTSVLKASESVVSIHSSTNPSRTSTPTPQPKSPVEKVNSSEPVVSSETIKKSSSKEKEELKEDENTDENEKEENSEIESSKKILDEIHAQRNQRLKEIETIIAEDLKKPAFENPLFSKGLEEWVSTKKTIQEPPREMSSDMIEQLEFSLLNCPDSLDSEVPRLHEFVLSQPHPTSIYFPQEPMKFYYSPNSSSTPSNIERLYANLNKSDIYSRTSLAQICTKFDLDTLFFIFYHYQGTYEQFIAARELDLRGWMFNKVDKYWYHKQKEINFPSSLQNNMLNGDGMSSGEHDNQDNASESTVESWRYFDYKSSWIKRRVGADFVYREEDFEKL